MRLAVSPDETGGHRRGYPA